MDLPAHLPKPKLCSLRKWENFAGYGFNLHSEKGKPGQFIGKVDPNSPAFFGGLFAHDFLIEVNGVNVEEASHHIAVGRVKSIPDRVDLFVCGQDTYNYCKEKGIKLSSAMLNIEEHNTPLRKPTPPPEYQPETPTAQQAAVEAADGTEFEEVKQQDLPERFRASPQMQQRSNQLPQQVVQAATQEAKRDSNPAPSVTVTAPAAAAPPAFKSPPAASAPVKASPGGDPVGNTSLEEVRARLGQSKRNQVKMMGSSFSEKYNMFESL